MLDDDPSAFFRLADAGTIAHDSSASAHDGQLSTGLSTGVVGAIVNDTDTAVTGPTGPVLAASTPLATGSADRTVELWVKPSAAGDMLFRWTDDFGVRLTDDHTVDLVKDATATPVAMALPYPIVGNRWHQVAATVSGGTVIVYLDGQIVGTSELGALATPSTSVFTAGGVAGSYDEVAVYPSVLPATRILRHWSVGSTSDGSGCISAPTGAALAGYVGAVMSSSPAAWWRLDDSAAGPIAADSSGNCLNGAYGNVSEAHTDHALLADDRTISSTHSDQWALSAPAADLSSANAPRTLELWVEPAAGQSGLRQLLSTNGLAIALDPTAGELQVSADGAVVGSFPTYRSSADGHLHHVAVTFDGTVVRGFLDGAEVGRTTTTVTLTSSGERGLLAGKSIGRIDEVAVYPSALSESTLSAHWTLGASTSTQACVGTPRGAYPDAVLGSAPVGWWRLSEQHADPTAVVGFDSSGNCRNAFTGGSSASTGLGALPREGDGSIAGTGVWLPAAGLPTGDAPRSLDFWVRHQTATSAVTVDYGTQFRITVTKTNVQIDALTPGVAPRVVDTGSTPIGAWSYVAVSYLGSGRWLVSRDGSVDISATPLAPVAVDPSRTVDGIRVAAPDADVDELAVYSGVIVGHDSMVHWSAGVSAAGTACAAPTSSGHTQAVLDDHPWGFWRAGDPATTGGTTWVPEMDSSGNCNNARANVVTPWAPPLVADPNQAHYGAFQVGLASESPSSWTLDGWLNSVPSGSAAVGVTGFSPDTHQLTALSVQSFTGGFHVIELAQTPTGFTTTYLMSVPAPTIADLPGWVHVALVSDAGQIRLLYNGQVVGTATASITNAVPAALTAIGVVDEIAWFDHALNNAQILHHMTSDRLAETRTTVEVQSSSGDAHVTVRVAPGLPGGATPTGTVTLTDNGTQVGTALTLVDGLAATDLPLSGDGHSLVASYSGSSISVASRSLAWGHGASTMTTLTGASSAPAGVVETFTAHVAPTESTNATVPTGFVTLEMDGAAVSSKNISASGDATFTVDPPAGGHTFTAVYGGDPSFKSSRSTDLPQATTRWTPGIVATNSGPASSADGAATITVTATAATGGPRPVDGTVVTIVESGNTVGTGTLTGGRADIEVHDIADGSHTYVARLAADRANVSADADPVTVTTSPLATITITDPTSPVHAGRDATFDVSVTPFDPSHPGSITLTGGASSVSVAVSEGHAVVRTHFASAGDVEVTAHYSGDPVAPPTTSSSHTTTVGKGIATVAVAPQSVGAVVGTPTPVHVGVEGGWLDPADGTISLFDGTAQIGTIAASSATHTHGTGSHVRSYDFDATFTSAGKHELHATYSASPTFDDAASTVSTSTTVAVTATAVSNDVHRIGSDPLVVGVANTIAAAVSAIDASGDVWRINGTIAVLDGSTVLASSPISGDCFTVIAGPCDPGTSATATITLPILSEGHHDLQLRFNPNAVWLTPTTTSLPIQVGPEATVTLTPSTTTAEIGQPVDYNVAVSFPDGHTPIGDVTLGGVDPDTSGLFVVDSTGHATIHALARHAGDIAVSATFWIGVGTSRTVGGHSSAIEIHITGGAGVVALTTASGHTPGVVATNHPITVQAHVASTWWPADSGTATFYESGSTEPVASANVTGGIASATFTYTAAGVHHLHAVYSGNDEITAATSDDFTVYVQPATSITLSSDKPTSVREGRAVTFTAAVAPSDSALTQTPAGTVTFSTPGLAPTTVDLVAGVATWTTTALVRGDRSITATFAPAGSSAWAGSTTSIPQTVDVHETTVAAAATSGSYYPHTVIDVTAASLDPSDAISGFATINDTDTTTGLHRQFGPYPLASGTGSSTTHVDVPLGDGTHQITVAFGGAIGLADASTTALTLTVNPVHTHAVLSIDPGSYTYPNRVSVDVVVTSIETTDVINAGTVQIFSGPDALGEVPVGTDGHARGTVPTPGPGAHTLTATYQRFQGWLASDPSAGQSVTVGAAPTRTAVEVTPNPSLEGSAITAVIWVSSLTGGTPSGTVDLAAPSGTVASGPLDSSGHVDLTIPALPAGSTVLTATFIPAGTLPAFAASSGATTAVVRRAVTVTHVAPTTATYNTPLSATTHVAPTSGTGTPGGTVTLMSGAGPVATSTLDASGNATLVWTQRAETSGAEISVRYDGDVAFAPSASAATHVSFTQSDITLTATFDSEPSGSHRSTTLTVHAAPVAPATAAPQGDITISGLGGDPVTLHLDTTGRATRSATFDGTSDRTIQVSYAGSATAASKTTTITHHIVHSADISLTTPSAPLAGQATTVQVSAADPDGPAPSGSLSSNIDGATGPTSTMTNGVANLAVPALTIGDHELVVTLTAVGFAQSAKQQTIHVTAVGVNATVSVPRQIMYGQAATVTASLTPAVVGGLVPTGFATFHFGTASTYTAAVGSDGTATAPIPVLDTGDHAISVDYGGSPRHGSASATAVAPLHVAPAATHTAITTTHGPAAPGSIVAFNVDVAPGDPATGDPTGTVTVSSGDAALASNVALDHGHATINIAASSTIGVQSLTASYAPSVPNFVSSTSAPYSQMVLPAATVALTPPSNPTVGVANVFSVSLTGGSGVPTGQIDLLDGSTIVATGSLVDGVATLSTTKLSAGQRSLTYHYRGDIHYAETETTQAKTVAKGTAHLALNVSNTPATINQALRLAASFDTLPADAPAPTGTLTFKDGTATLGTAAASASGATLTYSFMATGSKNPLVSYPGDANYNSVTSATSPITVVNELTARLSATVTSGIAPLSVSFNTVGTTGAPTSASWDFGDGTTLASTYSTATGHTFTTPGTYIVSLRGTRSDGAVGDASVTVRVADPTPATAEVGVDKLIGVGQAAAFGGADSTPINGIDSYAWDFGDGHTATTADATHAYDDPGTYTASLTVKSAGTTSKSTSTVSVVDSAEGVTVHVTDAAGVVNGATAVAMDSKGAKHTATSDGSGDAILRDVANGENDVYVYAPDHTPKHSTVTVVDGVAQLNVVLEPGSLVGAAIEHRKLSGPEAEDIGLDPAGNNATYLVDVTLQYGSVKVGVDYHGVYSCTLSTVCSYAGDGVVGHIGSGDNKESVSATTINQGSGIVIFTVPEVARWTKEIFQVDAQLVSLAAPPFYLADTSLTLELPHGLSLAETKIPATRSVSVGTLTGGSVSKTWFVTGDNAGSYTPGLTVNARLEPALGTSITQKVSAATPLVVKGLDRAKIEVSADSTVAELAPLHVRTRLVNTDTTPMYNAKLGFAPDPTSMVNYVYQPGQTFTSTKGVLAPGDSIVLDLYLIALRTGTQPLSDDDSAITSLGLDHDHSGVATVDGTTVHQTDITPLADADAHRQRAWKGPDPTDPTEHDPYHQLGVHWDGDGPHDIYQLETGKGWVKVASDKTGSWTYKGENGNTGFFAIKPAGDVENTTIDHLAVAGGIWTEGSFGIHDVELQCHETGHSPTVGWSFHMSLAQAKYDRAGFIRVQAFSSSGEKVEMINSVQLNIDQSGQDELNLEPSFVIAIPSRFFDVAGEPVSIKTKDGDAVATSASLLISLAADDETLDDGSPRFGAATPIVVVDDCHNSPVGVSAPDTFGYFCQRPLSPGSTDVTTSTSNCRADPVNTATGALVDHATDVALPTAGPALAVERTYNSLDPRSGMLGTGWSTTLDTGLEFPAVPDGSVIVRSASGQRTVFQNSTSQSEVYSAQRSSQTLEHHATGMWAWTLTASSGAFTAFDEAGRYAATSDEHGSVLTATRNNAGVLTGISEPSGRTIGITMSGDHVTSLSLPGGLSVGYGYQGDLLTSVTDTRGGITRYSYDSAGRMTEAIDQNGHRTHHTDYDSNGRAIRQIDALGGITTFVWDADTQTSTMIDSAGQHWVDTYKDNILVRSSDPVGKITSYAFDLAGNLTGVVDGKTTRTFAYDSEHRVTRATATDGARTSVTYRSDGRVSEATNASGGVTTYHYDLSGNLASATSPTGHTTTLTNDSLGRVVASEDPTGVSSTTVFNALGKPSQQCVEARCVTRTFDAYGRELTSTDPAGAVTQTTYNEVGLRTSSTDPLGNVTTYTYDAVGNLTDGIDATGVAQHYTWLPGGLLATKRDGTAPPTTFAYDSRGNITAITDPTGATTRYDYDAAGRRVAVTDAAGGVTRVTYDRAGDPVTVTDAAGASVVSTFDSSHRLLTTTDAAGAVTRHTYDEAGRESTTTDPKGRVTTFHYDSEGRLDRTTNPRGTARTTFDAAGRPTSRTDEAGNVTRFRYDSAGMLESTTDPLGGDADKSHTSRVTRDAAGRVTATTDADGQTSSVTFDAAGRQTATRDPQGRSTVRTYDGAGRVRTVTAPDGGVTSYTYDGVGDLVTLEDQRHNSTHFTYDAAHREIDRSDQAGRHTTTVFDGAGRVVKIIDPNGWASSDPGGLGATSFSYDARGALTRVDYGDPNTPDVSYKYDGSGQQTSMTDGFGTRTQTYDAAGALTAVLRGTRGFRYHYDTVGNLDQTTLPDATATSGATTVNATSTPTGQTDTLQVSGLGTNNFSYDPKGELTSIIHPDSTTDNLTWDPTGTVSAWTVTKGSNSLWARTYTHNAAGDPLTASSPSTSSTFGYDASARLASEALSTSITPPNGNPAGDLSASGTASFGYDTAGNRTAVTPVGGVPQSLTYDNADRVTNAGYSYDSDGRLLTDGTFNYTWNQAGQLVSADQVGPRSSQKTAPQAITGDNPVGYWRFGATTTGSFSNTATSSLPLNAPTVQSTMSVDPGAVTPDDGATRGVLGFVTVATPATATATPTKLTGAFTIEWNQRATASTASILRFSGGVQWEAGYSGNTMYFRNAQTTFNEPLAVSYNAWHHLAVTSDGTTMKWYVDGSLTATKVVAAYPTPALAAGSISMGRVDLDEVSIYDHPIPSATLAAHAGHPADYAAAVFAEHPLNYWRLGEAQGTPVFEDSGSSHFNGTTLPYQVPTPVPGAVVGDDGAIKLDGYDDAVTSPASTTYGLGGPNTVEMWLRADRPAQTTEQFMTWGPNYCLSCGGWAVQRNTDNSLTYARNAQLYRSSPNLVGADWVHVALVFDGTNYTWFRNGVAWGRTPMAATGLGPAPTQPNQALIVGRTASTPSPGLSIDELAIFNTAIPGGHYQVPGGPAKIHVNYGYDGDGLLTTRQTSAGTSRYWWDTNRALPALAVEETPTGFIRTTVTGPTGPLAVRDNGVWHTTHTNPQGTIEAVTSASGAVESTRVYTANGDQHVTTGTMPTWAQQWSGGIWDPDLGQWYFRARWMNPATAAFTSPDPIRPTVGQPAQSPYTYTYGHPTQTTDPSGLLPGAIDQHLHDIAGTVGTTVAVIGAMACGALTEGLATPACVAAAFGAGGGIGAAGQCKSFTKDCVSLILTAALTDFAIAAAFEVLSAVLKPVISAAKELVLEKFGKTAAKDLTESAVRDALSSQLQRSAFEGVGAGVPDFVPADSAARAFVQDFEKSCVAAACRYAVNSLTGTDYGETVMRAAAGTGSTGGPMFGATYALDRFGISSVYTGAATLSDVAAWARPNRPAIVSILVGDAPHAVVVESVADGRVLFVDSATGAAWTVDTSWFEHKMTRRAVYVEPYSQ